MLLHLQVLRLCLTAVIGLLRLCRSGLFFPVIFCCVDRIRCYFRYLRIPACKCIGILRICFLYGISRLDDIRRCRSVFILLFSQQHCRPVFIHEFHFESFCFHGYSTRCFFAAICCCDRYVCCTGTDCRYFAFLINSRGIFIAAAPYHTGIIRICWQDFCFKRHCISRRHFHGIVIKCYRSHMYGDL